MRDRITPLLTEAQIHARVREMGARLAADYAGKDLVVVGLLNGVFPFFADLVRSMELDFDVSFAPSRGATRWWWRTSWTRG
jgi:hypoxanthine-guanine phosphoribosyltransferase